MSAKIVLLPGDGIGPEVTAEAEKLIRALASPAEPEKPKRSMGSAKGLLMRSWHCTSVPAQLAGPS